MAEQTVFIVDDDAAVRDSIQELVESVGLHAQSYASAQAFLDSFQPERSGCLVLDVPMAVRALQVGAVDFIQKPYRDQLLLDSINKALAADAAARRAASERVNRDQQLAVLTEREREVFGKLLEGSSTKHIARELGISPRTVEVHRQHVLRKLKVGSVKELLRVLVVRDSGG